MNKENFYTLIDIGSSKIRLSVFDSNLNEKFSKTENINNNDFFYKFDVINNIVKKAEKKISLHIKDVILIFDTADIFTVDISLNKNLDRKFKVNKIYESIILELNQIINSNYNNYYHAHTVINKCVIDEKIYYEIPKNNEIFQNIKIDFKIILFPGKTVSIVKEKFIKYNLNVKNIFCTSYLKSLSYSKKLGFNKICFLEIGWERTSLISLENNKLKFIKSIPVGGNHITKDISKIFKIDHGQAEKIKKSFNKSETEFSYNSEEQNSIPSIHGILSKNISIDVLKKVILYRVQEIIDLTFKKSDLKIYKYDLSNFKLFLIGEGSSLFNSNSFYLNDKFGFKSINFYKETDAHICKSGLTYYLNNYQIPKIIQKNQGIFEKFFNYFSK